MIINIIVRCAVQQGRLPGGLPTTKMGDIRKGKGGERKEGKKKKKRGEKEKKRKEKKGKKEKKERKEAIEQHFEATMAL